MRLSERARAVFSGTIDPRPLLVCRTLISLVVLVRTHDALRPLVDLDHHRWVHGLEFAPWSEPTEMPRLAVGLFPGAALLLWPPIAGALVITRTAAAVTMLVGVAPRASALALGLSGYALMAADRFRYLHHMHLLWTTCLLLALVPELHTRTGSPLLPRIVPRWPVTLLRLHVLVIYAASGVAKLRGPWLDGTTIAELTRLGLVDASVVSALGAANVGRLTCALELLLVPLLAIPRTRAIGVALALAFHLATSQLMMVSVFPVIMAALLVLFLEPRRMPS